MFARYGRGGGAGLLVALAMAGVSGCGGSDSGGSSERDQADAIRVARADARREARAEAKAQKAADDAKALQKQIDELKKGSGAGSSSKSSGSSSGSSGGSSSGGSVAPSSSGSTSCGGGLSVNSVTTCPFAENVRSEYNSSGGSSVVAAFSPATGKVITMSCSSGVTTICRGGSGAIVYIR